MFKKRITVKKASELCRGNGSFFVQKANSFDSRIWIENPTCQLNAKSLLCVMSSHFTPGYDFTLSADGPDEEQAVQELASLC